MDTKAVVFYCKDCGGLFFAAVNEIKVLKESAEEIVEYIHEGHRLEVIEKQSVRSATWCKCALEQETPKQISLFV